MWEKDLLSKKEMIYATTAFERWVHLLLAGTCIYLFLTGIGFMFHSFAFIPTLIGGHLIPKFAHNYVGLIYFAATLCAASVWRRECMTFHDYDKDWLKKGGGYLKKTKDLPQSGRYNAGQKVFFIFAVVMGFYMLLTGLIMWFPLAFPKILVRICYLMHSIGALAWGIAIVIHGFLGSFMNPGSFQVMMHGYVTKEWARSQHGRWYKELQEKSLPGDEKAV